MKELLLDYLDEVGISLRHCSYFEYLTLCVLLADGNRRCITVSATQFKDWSTRDSARIGHLCPPFDSAENVGRGKNGKGSYLRFVQYFDQ